MRALRWLSVRVKAVSIPEYDMEEVEEYDRDTFTP